MSRSDVHDQVCPVILDLTCPDAMDDFKTEAVAVSRKPVVWLIREGFEGRKMLDCFFVITIIFLCMDMSRLFAVNHVFVFVLNGLGKILELGIRGFLFCHGINTVMLSECPWWERG